VNNVGDSAQVLEKKVMAKEVDEQGSEQRIAKVLDTNKLSTLLISSVPLSPSKKNKQGSSSLHIGNEGRMLDFGTNDKGMETELEEPEEPEEEEEHSFPGAVFGNTLSSDTSPILSSSSSPSTSSSHLQVYTNEEKMKRFGPGYDDVVILKSKNINGLFTTKKEALEAARGANDSIIKTIDDFVRIFISTLAMEIAIVPVGHTKSGQNLFQAVRDMLTPDFVNEMTAEFTEVGTSRLRVGMNPHILQALRAYQAIHFIPGSSRRSAEMFAYSNNATIKEAVALVDAEESDVDETVPETLDCFRNLSISGKGQETSSHADAERPGEFLAKELFGDAIATPPAGATEAVIVQSRLAARKAETVYQFSLGSVVMAIVRNPARCKLVASGQALGANGFLMKVGRNTFIALKVKHQAMSTTEMYLRTCVQSCQNVDRTDLLSFLAAQREMYNDFQNIE
jgi:hypothetical protein